jgi:hypothetical protein
MLHVDKNNCVSVVINNCVSAAQATQVPVTRYHGSHARLP